MEAETDQQCLLAQLPGKRQPGSPGEGEDQCPGNPVTSTPRPGLSESHPDLPLLLLAGSGEPDKQAVCLLMCPGTGVTQPGPLQRERGEALEGRQPL